MATAVSTGSCCPRRHASRSVASPQVEVKGYLMGLQVQMPLASSQLPSPLPPHDGSSLQAPLDPPPLITSPPVYSHACVCVCMWPQVNLLNARLSSCTSPADLSFPVQAKLLNALRWC